MRVTSSRPRGRAIPRWTLLRLLDCAEDEPNAIASAVNVAAAAPAREERSAPQRSRQVGILVQKGGELLPVMIGGAFQQFDAQGQRWVTTGIAVAAASERSGIPAGETDPRTSSFVAGWDDGISAFLRPGGHIEPLVGIVDSIRAAIEQDVAQDDDPFFGQPAFNEAIQEPGT